MRFNWDINLGTVISVVALLVTLVKMHVSNIRRIERLEQKIEIMFLWFQANVINKTSSRHKRGEDD